MFLTKQSRPMGPLYNNKPDNVFHLVGGRGAMSVVIEVLRLLETSLQSNLVNTSRLVSSEPYLILLD